MRILSRDLQSQDSAAVHSKQAIATAAAAVADRLEELELELQQAQDYADRLVAHKDMLCLPADLEGLRSANSHFAMENHILREQLRNK